MLDHERKRISLPPIFWKKIGKSTLKIRIHVPLSKGYFKTPPLPCPAALRGVVYKIEAEAKGKYISPSSSVFCAAKYRGGVRRTEGLKNSDSNKIKYQTLPLPCPAALRGVVYKIEAEAKGEYISPSSSVFCAAKYRRGGRRTEGLEKNKKRVDV